MAHPLDGARKFQFTRPRGARLSRARHPVLESAFQFTRPRGARQSVEADRVAQKRFNSRAHGGRDKHTYQLDDSGTWFQFTRPRGARRRPQKERRWRNVSIHAPTGGATYWGSTQPVIGLFQFTRPRGARPCPAPPPAGRDGFNSRAHGGRDWNPRVKSRVTDVSIHAPTGGATRVRMPRRDCYNVSIHAPTGGATDRGVAREGQRGRFNSRAHGGRDACPAPPPAGRDGFNSRAHGGRDFESSDTGSWAEVSIHAPTGGATPP